MLMHSEMVCLHTGLGGASVAAVHGHAPTWCGPGYYARASIGAGRHPACVRCHARLQAGGWAAREACLTAGGQAVHIPSARHFNRLLLANGLLTRRELRSARLSLACAVATGIGLVTWGLRMP